MEAFCAHQSLKQRLLHQHLSIQNTSEEMYILLNADLCPNLLIHQFKVSLAINFAYFLSIVILLVITQRYEKKHRPTKKLYLGY